MNKILTAIGLLVVSTVSLNAQTNCVTLVRNGVTYTQCERPNRPEKPLVTCATIVRNGVTYTQCE